MAEYYLKRSEGSAGAGDMLLNFVKKRKLCSSECECLHCADVEPPENSVSSAASVAYGCSSADEDEDEDESSGGVKESVVVSPDLEDTVGLQSECLDSEVSMAINCRIDYHHEYSTPTSETCGEYSEQSSLESTPHAASPHRNSATSTAARMPSAAEIEKFFAAAENYEQKRFAEKYNYDISKDVPLEGKYEWVPLHP